MRHQGPGASEPRLARLGNVDVAVEKASGVKANELPARIIRPPVDYYEARVVPRQPLSNAGPVRLLEVPAARSAEPCWLVLNVTGDEPLVLGDAPETHQLARRQEGVARACLLHGCSSRFSSSRFSRAIVH